LDFYTLTEGMKRFGSTERDICIHGLGIEPEMVNQNVVIAPWWEPNTLPKLGEAELLSNLDSWGTKVWNITHEKLNMTYIKTGIGAPCFLEGLLPLGVTGCKRIIFIGSVGSPDTGIGIGDIVLPAYSICGDGTSRYITSDDITRDVFGDRVYPDSPMFAALLAETERICEESHTKWHMGKTFSIDTIFAQYAHIDAITAMGCNVIEMETAVAFRGAALMGIPLVAIFSVSDNTVTNKSLVSGRTDEDMEYRKYVRREVFPNIILSVFSRMVDA